MKVIIIGANGKIGKRITQQMSASEAFEPVAFIRKAEQQPYFDDMGVPVIVESLEDLEESIVRAIEGFDAVVFTAGSGAKTGYDKTMEIDLYGAVKTIRAAKANGIRRFVMVSAAFSDVPSFWSAYMRPYYIAKQLADAELVRSELDYTILRPVRLTDDDEAGNIMIKSDPHQLNGTIPRAAVAAAVLAVLPNTKTHGKVMEMSEGEDEIGAAIQSFV